MRQQTATYCLCLYASGAALKLARAGACKAVTGSWLTLRSLEKERALWRRRATSWLSPSARCTSDPRCDCIPLLPISLLLLPEHESWRCDAQGLSDGAIVRPGPGQIGPLLWPDVRRNRHLQAGCCSLEVPDGPLRLLPCSAHLILRSMPHLHSRHKTTISGYQQRHLAPVIIACLKGGESLASLMPLCCRGCSAACTRNGQYQGHA